jgi:hypothetical protein
VEVSLRFAKPTNGRIAAAFCVNCDCERPVAGGRCFVCKRKVHVKVSKFGNKPTNCASGTKHQSMAEAARCDELHMLQRAGVISGLQAHPQPSFELSVNGVHVCTYRSDFAYLQPCDSIPERVVEDVKGFATDVFRIKQKLMRAILGIEVKVTQAKRGARR